MYNSTIAYNTSEAIGSGGVSQNGEAQIRNSTITNNVAMNEEGGGIRNKGVLFLGNTIVANNNAPLNKDISGTINSYGNNLVRTRGGSVGYVASDLPDGTSANLGALQNNGGETDTRALMSNSPAIDAGNDCITVPGCSGEFYYDQRGVGFPRKIGSAVDIGAFEFQGRNSGVVQISGKVLKPNGRGLNNAVVTLTGSEGRPRSVETDQHGNFSFDEVTPNEAYVIAAESRQNNYASQNLFVTATRDDVTFVPIETREPVDAPR
jgi:hypothetical protein